MYTLLYESIIVIYIHHNMYTWSLCQYTLLQCCYMCTLIYIYTIVIRIRRYMSTSSLYVYICICTHECYLFLSLLLRHMYPSFLACMCIFVQRCIIICVEITVPAHMHTSSLYGYIVIICIHPCIIIACIHPYMCTCVYMYKDVSL